MVMENKEEEREMIVEGGSQCQAKGKEQTGAGWPLLTNQRKKEVVGCGLSVGQTLCCI